MEEQAHHNQSQVVLVGQHQGSDPNTPPPVPPPPSSTSERPSEPVRSRWTPKPEQILILESIFNSGMVNPPKDETVRIRKLLEKFGSVGDANVFYWFQNRRSRSRRRQRQLQAQAQQASYTTGAIHHQFTDNGYTVPPLPVGVGGFPPAAGFGSAASPSFLVGTGSSSCGGGGDQSLLAMPPPPAHQQMGVHAAQIGQSSSMLWPSTSNGSQNLQFESDSMTVFINGVATAVPRGPIDMKAFGEDVILVHSSGFPLPINDFGCISLQHGETYFLVSRAC